MIEPKLSEVSLVETNILVLPLSLKNGGGLIIPKGTTRQVEVGQVVRVGDKCEYLKEGMFIKFIDISEEWTKFVFEGQKYFLMDEKNAFFFWTPKTPKEKK